MKVPPLKRELKPELRLEFDIRLMEETFRAFVAERDGNDQSAECDPVVGHNALSNHRLVD